MLTEGTTTRDTFDILIAQEELGASISAWAEVDASSIRLTSLTGTLPQSLGLMADVAMNPSFAEEDFSRVQTQRLAEIAEELTQPGAIAGRAMGPLLFGEQHPYAYASTIGTSEVVQRLSTADMRAEHAEWVRPDLASFTVVGDIDMASLLPLLERAFGQWALPANARPAKAIDAPVPPARQRLVVIDRPNSPQSVLMLGRLLPLTGMAQGIEPLELANEVMGNGFLSRLNMDLREARGWTYGVRSSLPGRVGPQALVVATAVQADRTADSIRAIVDQMGAFPASRPVHPVELQRVTDGNARGLPNRFETNEQVLGALLVNQLFGRPDDYQERLPDIYRAIGAAQIDTAARDFLHPRDMAIVVVGDRSVIDEQVATLGMQVEYLDAGEL
jgi:predicted Zn-dependent peptidase